MARRLSPNQLKAFKEIIHGKRILDIGDRTSQFLAEEFARYTKSWTVIGRTQPHLVAELPSNVCVIPDPFNAWQNRPPPTDFDVVLFPSPSPSLTQDADCLEWTTPEQTIIFFGHPTDETIDGSPSFWKLLHQLKLVKELVIQRDEKDLWSRFLVMHKALEETEKAVHHGSFPKRGERYRLANSCKWPGKKPGDKPPVVEIAKNWDRAAGPAKMIERGEVIHLHKADLGSPM